MNSDILPLNIAIVGSGPAGFFCADYLLRLAQPCTVDMYEQWPAPYGLVRHAVAPDRQKIRAATAAFDRIAAHEGFHFFGNVRIGEDISLAALDVQYNAVVLATGACQARPLQLEGENLPGCYHAVDFAGWYNGRLDHADLNPDLSRPGAVIIGAGNAALDAARILAVPTDHLRQTDISSAAMDALASSKITDIHLMVRRGPFETRFSVHEFEELCRIGAVQIHLYPDNIIPEQAPENAELSRLWKAYNAIPPRHSPGKHLYIHFHTRPHAILGDNTVSGVLFDSARGTVHVSCGIVISAIGQTASPVAGIDLDPLHGVIPNRGGRVLSEDTVIPGIYTAGWAKRGAFGVIGTNKPDCRETVQSIMDDRRLLIQRRCKNTASLPTPNVPVVTLAHWKRIDEAERARGAGAGKSRDRFLTRSEMLEAAGLKQDC